MNRYDLVLFDIDGTLLDTADDITNAANFALRSLGYPERTADEVRSFVGNGVRNRVIRCMPESERGKEDKIAKMTDLYRSHYIAHICDNTKPYPGIPELLETLKRKNIRLGVLSNKGDDVSKMLMERYFGDLFDTVYGKRNDYPRKPAPDSLFAILAELNVASDRAAYVGDSEVDVALCRNAGVDGCFVSWGFRTKEQLLASDADPIINNANELKTFLLSEK